MGTTEESAIRKPARHATAVRYVPLSASLAGMVLILGSIVLFDGDITTIVGATAGILALLAAVWYAGNPFLKNTRRYLLLRAEVMAFISITRELNHAVVNGAAAAEIEAARDRLHECVDRVVAAAGRTQATARRAPSASRPVSLGSTSS